MNDDQLQFDRTCHVIYSRPCKAEIREKIALSGIAARSRLGARADAVCRLFERLAHRPWRGEKLPQRPGRQLRLHRADGVLRRLQGRDKPSRDRGDGGEPFPAVVPKAQQAQIHRHQQAALQKAPAPRVFEREKAVRQVGRL